MKLAGRGHVVLKMNADTSKNLFADATVPCFFRSDDLYIHLHPSSLLDISRRPCFTPDGALLLVPTGVYKSASGQQSFCTYVVSRNNLTTPIVCLPGLEEPSIAVRCSPVVYKLKPSGSPSEPMIPGNYRSLISGPLYQL